MKHLEMADVLSLCDLPKYQARANHNWQKAGLTDLFSPQHYPLLQYLARRFDKDVLELGAGTRLSTLCLASGLTAGRSVCSTDVVYPTISAAVDLVGLPAVVYNEDCVDFLVASDESLFDFIFIDVDHSGVAERKILRHLLENNWTGCVLLDDARAGQELKKIITEQIAMGLDVYDLTRWGHWSGSLLVSFGMPLDCRCSGTRLLPLKNFWS